MSDPDLTLPVYQVRQRVIPSLFCGVTCQHSPFMLHVISLVLDGYGQHIRQIVELGTAFGGLSLYLGLWGRRLDVPVHTFDHIAHVPERPQWRMLDELGVTRHVVDIFSQEGREAVIELLGRCPTYLLCDNGNKPRELRTFVPHLQPGSIVSTHDWGTEVLSKDVQMLVIKHRLKAILPQFWSDHYALLASWKVPEK